MYTCSNTHNCLYRPCDEIDALDSASNVGGLRLMGVSSFSSVTNKKLANAIALADDRSRQLDGYRAMKEGKQGVFRHQTQLSLQMFEKDAQKRKLEQVINLKNKFGVYMKCELLGPEHIADQPTQRIAQLIIEITQCLRSHPSLTCIT